MPVARALVRFDLAVGQPAGQPAVQRHAEREQVRAGIRRRALPLLGVDVARRAGMQFARRRPLAPAGRQHRAVEQRRQLRRVRCLHGLEELVGPLSVARVGRILLHHRAQLVLSVLGVALGVAVVLSIDLATTSARTAFRVSAETVSGRATHQIVAEAGAVDERLLARLRIEAGVRASAPDCSSPMR